nr:MAG TPA: Major capsid protein [Caudoviricetes sp.]
MPGVTGMATTYSCPNYTGELFQLSPESTPFLSAIGGLTGGVKAESTVFGWQSYDLRDAADDRQRTEGADAPDPDTRVRDAAHNVCEIHQETVSVSYTKLSAIGQVKPLTPSVTPLGEQPVKDETTKQIESMIKAVARDVEKGFIVGKYQLPTDNTQPRKTRGILEAITSNSVDASSGPLTETLVLDLMQKVWDIGGIQEDETRTIIVGAKQKRALTKIFITDKRYQEASRNVGGVNVQTIETDFGKCNIMLSRYMPPEQLAVVSLEQCAPAFLEVPGKGHFFVEPLAKTGASDRCQLYGEIGLKYGGERAHGKLINLG